MINIYRITFKEDNAVYIGQTKGSVKARINKHIMYPTNKALHTRLNTYQYKVETLHEGLDEIGANLQENWWIKYHAHRQPLLNQYIEAEGDKTRHKGKHKAVTDLVVHKCYICQQHKKARSFPKNESRPTGKNSACRSCMRYCHKKAYTGKDRMTWAQAVELRRKELI